MKSFEKWHQLKNSPVYWKVIYFPNFNFKSKVHLSKYIEKLYIWPKNIWQNMLESYIFDLLTVHCRFSRESGPGARTLPKIQSSKKHSLKHKDKCKYKYKTCVCILQNPANPALTCWFLLQVVGRPAKEGKWFSAPLTFVFFVNFLAVTRNIQFAEQILGWSVSGHLWRVQMNSFCVNLSGCGFDAELVEVWWVSLWLTD